MLSRKPANTSIPAQRASSKIGNSSSSYLAPTAVDQVVNSPGVPLGADVRAFFEPRFGFDFSHVRVHADSSAAATARSMDAAAYTVGQHITFDAGRYETRSQRGLQLIGHELAHTVQQKGAPRGGGLRMGSPTDASEKEADSAASSALSYGRVGIQSGRPMSVQRQPNQATLPELDPAAGASPMVAAVIGSMTIDQFATGKSEIPAARKAELARTAKYIVSLLKQYPGSKVHIVGNTDAVGKDEDNQTLGQSRADSVQQALVEKGVMAEAIETESSGASNLVVKTKMGDGRNRRVQVSFQPARQFPGLMSSHLDMSGGKAGVSGGGDAPPNLLPSHVCTTSPEICGGGDKVGPRNDRQPAPPGATQSLPSNIPWNLMDLSDCNDAYASHGSPSQIDDPMRATWAKAFMKYRGLGDSKAAKLANSEVCKTLGQDQSRDNPNTQDRFNQDWKNQNPNDKGIPPINPPFKPFQWKF
jgi:outer membrane protein OmpA-like peptidoglycan-associated protein